MIKNINRLDWFHPRNLTLEYRIVFKLFTNFLLILNKRIGDIMLDKVKYMKVEEKLRYCFTLVVIIASISGVLGLFFLFYNNIQRPAHQGGCGHSKGCYRHTHSGPQNQKFQGNLL